MFGECYIVWGYISIIFMNDVNIKMYTFYFKEFYVLLSIFFLFIIDNWIWLKG